MPSRRNTLLPLVMSSLDTLRTDPSTGCMELMHTGSKTHWPFPSLLAETGSAHATSALSHPCGPMSRPVVLLPENPAFRLRHVDELEQPWRTLISEMRVSRGEAPLDWDAEFTGVAAIHRIEADLLPGSATLAGVALAGLVMFHDACSEDRQYIFATSYDIAHAPLREWIESRMGMRMESEGGGHPGLFIETDEGGIWLHADPDDPSRTVLAVACVTD